MIEGLGGFLLVDQAALLDGLAFDAFSVEEDGLAAAEVDICRCEIAQALVVALVVVVVDEGLDLSIEIAGQVVVLEQDAVLQGLVPALDLALGLRMAGRTADMLDALSASHLARSASLAAMPVQSFQAMMSREKSSSTVER